MWQIKYKINIHDKNIGINVSSWIWRTGTGDFTIYVFYIVLGLLRYWGKSQPSEIHLSCSIFLKLIELSCSHWIAEVYLWLRNCKMFDHTRVCALCYSSPLSGIFQNDRRYSNCTSNTEKKTPAGSWAVSCVWLQNFHPRCSSTGDED